MIFVECMDLSELKRYANELEKQSDGISAAILSVRLDEILSYFKVWQNDKFLVVRFKGDRKSLPEELSYIKFPKRTFGRFVLCKSKTTIEEFVEVQRIIADTLSDDEWNPLLGWVGNSEENCIEFELITKVYDRSDVSDKMVFNSLLENIVHDMAMETDKSFCESLEKTPKRIAGDKIEFNMQGMTRSSFLMSLKKRQFEKLIYEYTGKKMTLEIL